MKIKIGRMELGWEKRESEPSLINRDGKLSFGKVAPTVTTEGALALSAVWRCVSLLSDTVAILPLALYKKNGDGRERIIDHPSAKVIRSPTVCNSKFHLLAGLMTRVLLWGNAYLIIKRDSTTMRPVKLLARHPATMRVVFIDDGADVVYYDDRGVKYDSWDVVHVKMLSTDGLVGRSPIATHRNNIELSMNAQRFGEQYFSQGVHTTGVFTHPGELSDEGYDRLRQGIMERSMGMGNAMSPMILEGGMKYEKVVVPPEDAQFIQTRRLQVTEIARIYGVPPHMLGDLERSTNNNIEHQGIEFVTYSLMPHLVKIEEELNRKLLTEQEQELGYYFKFNTNALLRGDAKSRAEFYSPMLDRGCMNANEVRALEDMNSYDGGEVYYVQRNMQTVEESTKQGEGNE